MKSYELIAGLRAQVCGVMLLQLLCNRKCTCHHTHNHTTNIRTCILDCFYAHLCKWIHTRCIHSCDNVPHGHSSPAALFTYICNRIRLLLLLLLFSALILRTFCLQLQSLVAHVAPDIVEGGAQPQQPLCHNVRGIENICAHVCVCGCAFAASSMTQVQVGVANISKTRLQQGFFWFFNLFIKCFVLSSVAMHINKKNCVVKN